MAVAEYTVALILNSVKRISASNSSLRNSEWKKAQVFNLSGKTLGIVGMGKVGYQVARIMKAAFGMNILYYSVHDKPEIDSELGANKVTLDELCTIQANNLTK